jgi:hypothetical protein
MHVNIAVIDLSFCDRPRLAQAEPAGRGLRLSLQRSALNGDLNHG